MKYYAGLDVSLKEISICVIDQDGEVAMRGSAPADAEGVAGWFRKRSLKPEKIVHESGQLSIWLQRGMTEMDLPAVCIDARKAHKSLSARLNKSDSADAEGLAQLARTNWFTPVHMRSENADRLRSLIGAHDRRPSFGDSNCHRRTSSEWHTSDLWQGARGLSGIRNNR